MGLQGFLVRARICFGCSFFWCGFTDWDPSLAGPYKGAPGWTSRGFCDLADFFDLAESRAAILGDLGLGFGRSRESLEPS